MELTATLIVLLVLGGVVARFRNRVSSGCAKCGLSTPPEPHRQLCDQCRSVFLTAAAVDPELRRKKEQQVRRHQRWRRWSERVIALVAGAGDVLGGRPISGVAILFVFCFAVTTALTPHGFGVYGWEVYLGDSMAQARSICGFGVASLASLWSVGRAFAR